MEYSLSIKKPSTIHRTWTIDLKTLKKIMKIDISWSKSTNSQTFSNLITRKNFDRPPWNWVWTRTMTVATYPCKIANQSICKWPFSVLAGLPVHMNGLFRRKKKISVLFSPHIVRTQTFLFFRGRFNYLRTFRIVMQKEVVL